MSRLPVMLSIPHGGTKRPPELDGRLCITDRDIFYDSDAFTVQIYDLGDRVGRVIKSEVARAFVDLNRSLQDLPPDNPDGLIKSRTCHQRPIYADGAEPDGELTRRLINQYYLPYHRDIQKGMRNIDDLQLCLDCHSMAPAAPRTAPDLSGASRPAFCLSNRDGRTSSSEMITLLASCIAKSYGVRLEDISFNDPFHGGHITGTYGNNPVPWIQIEMNRSLYLAEPWFDEESLRMDPARLEVLNGCFAEALEMLVSRMAWC